MWQCEYQSPVHDTSVKLQTIMELKQLKEGVTNANGKRIFIFPFWNPGVTFTKPTSQMSCYSKCMSQLSVGWGEVYWLGSDSTISQDVQQHGFKSNNTLYVTKRTALYLDSLVLILFWRLLPPINSNLMMCGFQRSRIHVPSFGKSFWIIW